MWPLLGLKSLDCCIRVSVAAHYASRRQSSQPFFPLAASNCASACCFVPTLPASSNQDGTNPVPGVPRPRLPSCQSIGSTLSCEVTDSSRGKDCAGNFDEECFPAVWMPHFIVDGYTSNLGSRRSASRPSVVVCRGEVEELRDDTLVAMRGRFEIGQL